MGIVGPNGREDDDLRILPGTTRRTPATSIAPGPFASGTQEVETVGEGACSPRLDGFAEL
jgi:hypothetical protein